MNKNKKLILILALLLGVFSIWQTVMVGEIDKRLELVEGEFNALDERISESAGNIEDIEEHLMGKIDLF